MVAVKIRARQRRVRRPAAAWLQTRQTSAGADRQLQVGCGSFRLLASARLQSTRNVVRTACWNSSAMVALLHAPLWLPLAVGPLFVTLKQVQRSTAATSSARARSVQRAIICWLRCRARSGKEIRY